MGVIIPLNYHQIVFRFNLVGDLEEMVTTLGGLSAPSDTLDDIALGAASAATADGSICEPEGMASSYTFVGVTIQRMTSTGIETAERIVNSVGASGTQSVPSNCAILVTKNTAAGGRRGRGRFFCPPFLLDENNIGPRGDIQANLANVQERWDNLHGYLVGPPAGAASGPSLFHSDASFPPNLITSFTVQSILATQRQRMR